MSSRPDDLEQRTARWIAFRRDLHQHPELSHTEARTAERVRSALAALPVSVRTGVAGHGVVAELEGARPGPTLAYRADMDALPIQELGEAAYRSVTPGVMHACGHDVHTAIGVALAEELARRREEVHGRVRFLFQPAEEATAPPGVAIGAEAMARAGALEGVDAALAVHCMPDLEVEHFGVPARAVWATSDAFDIRLEGRTAHAAYPHEGIDAVQMAAACVQALLALPARLTNPLEPCVLTVGLVQAGTAHNILAGEARLAGILRTFDEATRQRALAAMGRLVAELPAAFGGQGRISVSTGAVAVLNDPALRGRVEALLRETAGAARVRPHPPQMGAEDFSAFSTRVPGCYLFLGVANDAAGVRHPLHTPRFDVDERCIPFAVTHLANVLTRLGRDWSAPAPAPLPGEPA
jgi:amidohydrolase